MKAQDARGSCRGSFQGSVHAPTLLFARACPADQLISPPCVIQDTWGYLGPQTLCSQTSLENQLMVIVPESWSSRAGPQPAPL